jgi:CxxC motif-containing protein
MAAERNFICTACPKGCMLKIQLEGDEVVKIEGNTCRLGKDYAVAEVTDPRRMVASTVRIQHGLHPLLPVYTSAPVPKPKIKEVLEAIRQVDLDAPIKMKSVIVENIAGTGVNLLASRDMARVKEPG